MLPRLKPRCYYDLVIEVAIIRPGPIQGDMVHPYLRRRNGEEAVDYPSEEVKGVLQRTLGVPIFQEQVMPLAVVAAGFTPGEADRLRRAMAAWKRRGGLGPFEEKLIQGMRERGYSEEFARQIFRQIEGFGEYGFPESHSASFALLVYVSCWLKRHTPAAFTCALLNSQPMGFYSASQLVQDVRRHGVEVRGVDINRSSWDCTLEAREDGAAALRLGFRMVKGLSEDSGQRIVERRAQHRFESTQQLLERAGLDRRELGVLASSGALRALEGHRHQARWAVAGVEDPHGLFPSMDRFEAIPMLRKPTEGQDIVADYKSVGLTLERHPLHLIRHRLDRYLYVRSQQLSEMHTGRNIAVAGLVITRQRPGTASGVTFVTLEDETGHINLIVWKQVAKQYRAALLNARLMGVRGRITDRRKSDPRDCEAIARSYGHVGRPRNPVKRLPLEKGQNPFSLQVVVEVEIVCAVEIVVRTSSLLEFVEPTAHVAFASEIAIVRCLDLCDKLLDIDLDRDIADVVIIQVAIRDNSVFRGVFFDVVYIVHVVRITRATRITDHCQTSRNKQ